MSATANLHNKVLVIDGHTVVTGSYNFSEHAETNAENTVILTDPTLARAQVGARPARATHPDEHP